MRLPLSSLFLILPLCCPAAVVNVFFAGGQSNATVRFGNGVESRLQTLAGPGAAVSVVQLEHSGVGLGAWFSGGAPQSNYFADLAAIQAEMNAITAQGDTPVFSGFFWMQGEGDAAAGSATIGLYEDRFYDMLARYQADLGLAAPPSYIVGVIDANPDPFYTNNPGYLGWATRATIEEMRSVLFDIGADGAYYDTRGIPRVDGWHLSWPDQTNLGIAMANTFVSTYQFQFVPEPSATLLAASSVAFLATRRRRGIAG